MRSFHFRHYHFDFGPVAFGNTTVTGNVFVRVIKESLVIPEVMADQETR